MSQSRDRDRQELHATSLDPSASRRLARAEPSTLAHADARGSYAEADPRGYDGAYSGNAPIQSAYAARDEAAAARGSTATLRWRDRLILDTLRALLRHRALCAALVSIASAAGGVSTLWIQPYYIASARIYPPMAENPLGAFALPGMTGLLGNLGLNWNSGSQFPLYEKALDSRDLLLKLTETPLQAAGFDQTLLEYLHVSGPDSLSRIHLGVEAVRAKMRYVADSKSPVATISVRDRDPRVAALLVNRAVELLNEFDIATSTTQAGERRRFIEGRLLKASNQLTEVESRLETFREENLRIGNAPALLLEQARLQRELEIEQQIYLTLRKEAELANIEEHRSVPVVNILEHATPPLTPAGPSWLRNAVLSGFGAALLVVAFFAISAAQPRRIFARLELMPLR